MRRSTICALALLPAITGCGGGSGGGGTTTPAPVPSFTVGGQLSGMRSPGLGLTLALSTGETLKVLYDGAFSFATPIAQGSAYQVSVQTQPSQPDQICTVGNGSGTVGAGNVSVTVTCTTPSIVNILVANGYPEGSRGNTLSRDGLVRGFVLDPATGALVPRSAEPAPALISTIAYNPANQTLAVARWNTRSPDFTSWGRGDFFRFDILGVPKQSATISGGDQIAFNPASGGLYGLTPGEISRAFPERDFSYKPGRVFALTGEGRIGPYLGPVVGRGLRRLAFDPAGGALFVTGDGDGEAGQQRIYTLSLADPVTPAVTATVTPTFLPYAIAARPVGRFLYVTAPAGTLGYAFSYSAAGTLTPLGQGFPAPLDARAAIVSADGSRLYLAGTASAQLQCYAIGSDGVPAPRGPVVPPIAAGTRPIGMTFDPDGRYLYVLNQDVATNENVISGYAAGSDCSLTAIRGLPIAAGMFGTAITAARFTS